MTQRQSAAEPLLEFRLAYLRALARSWQDDAYRRELLDQEDIQPLLHRDFGLPTLWHWAQPLVVADAPSMAMSGCAGRLAPPG